MNASEQQKISIRSLKSRADFLRLRYPKKLNGYYVSSTSFLLQAAPAQGFETLSDANEARFGLTVTKKLGNAVTRNRIKRRLRACVKSLLPLYGQAGYDYVLIARQDALTRNYQGLLDEVHEALISPHRR